MANWWRNIATFKGKFTEVFTKDKVEQFVDEIKKSLRFMRNINHYLAKRRNRELMSILQNGL